MSKNDYKIYETLGYGSHAITYKIKIKDKYYAWRREKIPDENLDIYEDIEKDNLESLLKKTSSSAIKIIYFNKFINTLDTNHFLKLKKYKFTKADYILPLIDSEKNKDSAIQDNNKINNYKYSIDIITDLKDGTLNDIYNILTKHQVYSLIIQIIYALHLMHTNDFTHNDPSTHNIMYKKTKIKYIKILGLSIPTYGYIFSLIDYGDINNIEKFQYSDKPYIISHFNAYTDNIKFLLIGILNGRSHIHVPCLINKMINNPNYEMNSSILNLFESSLLNYKETKNYILLSNDEIKLIKYFYYLIK